MEIVLLTIAVLIVWSMQKRRRSVVKDRAELEEAVWRVVRLSYDRELFLEATLRCNFIDVVDGREQRLAWLHLDEFDLWFSKETKRPRVWVRLKKGENYTQIVCCSTSKLGKSVSSLFSSINQHSEKPEPATEVGHDQV